MSKKILKAIILFAIFVSLIYPYSDGDWGWHFRYGEYLVTHGQLLKNDIYSWTMQGYPWVNHEWLFDPIIYFVFKYSGYIGASLVGAAITFLCFWILTKPFKLKLWKLAVAGFFFSQLIESGLIEGLRGQVVGYLPLVILMFILVKIKTKPQWLWGLPPLFLIWVNLHGSWAFGLLITAVFFACYLFIYPKLRKTLFIVGFLALIATLFNPFGLKVYREVIKHASSPYLQNVFEWLPIYKGCGYCNLATAAIYLAILIIAAWKLPLVETVPFLITGLVLLWPAIDQRRTLAIFGIATLPLLLTYLEKLDPKFLQAKITPWILLVGVLVTVEYNLFNRLPEFHFYHYSEYDYCTFVSNCPVNLVKYLLSSPPPPGRGFNMYDWGGYLIGKGIAAPLFIDGRMHLWDAKGGYMPFADYVAIYFDQDWNTFNGYDFSWILVPTNTKLVQAVFNRQVEGNWIAKYQDEFATYFVRLDLK